VAELMSAVRLDLDDVEQGATYSRTITWASGTPAVPVDITGVTLHMQVRSGRSLAGTVLADLSIGAGIDVTDAVNGEFAFTLSATITASLPQSAYYDVLATMADLTKRRVIQGTISVDRQIST
jgi:hypothetical protein